MKDAPQQIPNSISTSLPIQLRFCNQELEDHQKQNESRRVHQENHQGHEDGGCIQDEAGRQQTREGQALRSRRHRQDLQKRNLHAQESVASRCQEDPDRALQLRQGTLRRNQLQHRQRSQSHGQGEQSRLQGVRGR